MTPSRTARVRAVRTERGLAMLRLGAAAVATALMVGFPEPYPQPSLVVAVASVVTLAGTSLAALAALRFTDAAARVDWRRVAVVTFAVDAVLVSALVLAHAFSASTPSFLVLLLLAPLGALRLGRTGAVAATAVVAAEEVARQWLRITVHGHAPSWDFSISVVVLTALIGGISAWLVDDARRAASDARSEALRAVVERRRADRSSRDLEALHLVVLAGIGGFESEALGRMTSELQAQLGYPMISVGLFDEHGHPVCAAHAGPSWPVGTPIPLDPDGPLSRLIAGAEAHTVPPAEIERISLGLASVRSAMVAPIRSQGRLIGHLSVESPAVDAYDDEDVLTLARIGDQMGLVLDAARAFQREAEVADQYRELDRLRRDFVAITSHELRTPLTAILGFAETLERLDQQLSPDRRAELVAAVGRQARRLEHVVDDLRTVGRLDAGTLSVEASATDLDRLVDTVLESTGDEDVIVDGEPGLWVHADPHRAHQVVVNLVRNAREHGRPPIELGWRSRDDHVTVTVRDHGRGVPAALRDRVFERFVQGADADAHSHGSGLGLSIARELTHAMGGDLTLRDTPGGACFDVRLRRAEAAP